jgi:hypothetical protein
MITRVALSSIVNGGLRRFAARIGGSRRFAANPPYEVFAWSRRKS